MPLPFKLVVILLLSIVWPAVSFEHNLHVVVRKGKTSIVTWILFSANSGQEHCGKLFLKTTGIVNCSKIPHEVKNSSENIFKGIWNTLLGKAEKEKKNKHKKAVEIFKSYYKKIHDQKSGIDVEVWAKRLNAVTGQTHNGRKDWMKLSSFSCDKVDNQTTYITFSYSALEGRNDSSSISPAYQDASIPFQQPQSTTAYFIMLQEWNADVCNSELIWPGSLILPNGVKLSKLEEMSWSNSPIMQVKCKGEECEVLHKRLLKCDNSRKAIPFVVGVFISANPNKSEWRHISVANVSRKLENYTIDFEFTLTTSKIKFRMNLSVNGKVEQMVKGEGTVDEKLRQIVVRKPQSRIGKLEWERRRDGWEACMEDTEITVVIKQEIRTVTGVYSFFIKYDYGNGVKSRWRKIKLANICYTDEGQAMTSEYLYL